MIDIPLLLSFLVAAVILTITPGVDTALVLRTCLVEGRKAALQASVGIALGCLAWGGAVSFGLGALLQASEWAYAVARGLGAAYLLWLGWGLLLRPRNGMDWGPGTVPSVGSNAFGRGLLANLLNPKVGVFYVTFLPQFVPEGAPVAVFTFGLACLHVALSLAWFALLMAATAPLSRCLREPRWVRLLDRMTAGVLIAFGIRLAVSGSR
jgi:threonine/homoserine/homoserine lactone efflux protein